MAPEVGLEPTTLRLTAECSTLEPAAQENRRAATIDAAAKQQEVAFRTAELFLEAEKAAKLEQLARQQAGSLERILATINARVAEGRELPIHSRRAALNLARAQYRSQVLESNRAYQECANSQAPLIRSTDTLVSSPVYIVRTLYAAVKPPYHTPITFHHPNPIVDQMAMFTSEAPAPTFHHRRRLT